MFLQVPLRLRRAVEEEQREWPKAEKSMSTLASCRQEKQIRSLKWLVQCFRDGRGFTFDQLQSGLWTQRPLVVGAH